MVRKSGVGFLLSLVLVLLAHSPALAENEYYVGFKTGASIQDYNDVSFVNPRITTGLKTDHDTDTEILYSLQIGRKISSSARLEFEAAATPQVAFERYYNNFPTTLQKIKIKSKRLMINGYYDLPQIDLDEVPLASQVLDFLSVKKVAAVYVSGGIGVGFNNTDATQGATSEFNDETSTDFAWSLGTGMSGNVSDNWTMDFGYRYVDLGEADTGVSAFSPFDEHFEGELVTHEVTLGVRYNFSSL